MRKGARTMTRWPIALVGALAAVCVAGLLWAEDVTVTTYYPSPRAVYNELQSRKIVDYDDAAFSVDPNLITWLNTANVVNLILGQDLTVGGTLTVAGITTLNGATQVNNTLDVTGATTLGSTLDVTGATTLGSTLAVTGASA